MDEFTKNSINSNISSNIRYLRLKKGITAKELAKACNLVDTAINNYEAGIRTPNAMILKKISDYFNVSIDDIVKTNLLNSDNISEITSSEFAQEVKVLLLKTGDLSDKEKNMILNTLNYICEEGEK